MIEVRDAHVDDLVDCEEWDLLAQEYFKECSAEGSEALALDMGRIRDMEACGIARALGVYSKPRGSTLRPYLVGAAYFFSAPCPYEQTKTEVVCEFVFVRKQWRKGPTGLKLLRAIEDRARDVGATGITFSAPVGSNLSLLCRLKGFKHTHEVFFKAV